MSQKTLLTFAHCDDCGSEHLNAPCGMTFKQRLQTTVVHGSVLSTRTKVDFYDDEGLKDIFGGDRKEREADMMDATDGRGYTTVDDIPYAN